MRILVIDDHKLIVDDIIDEINHIMPLAKCMGTTISDEALMLNSKYKFDVIFSDIEMPRMDGITLAKKLLEVNPNLNIIFVTGYQEYALEAYELYASGFLLKPVNGEKIKNALNNLRHPVSNITDSMIESQYNGSSMLGKRLEAYRDRRGISRKELADMMDVSVQTIYRWENGDRTPDLVTFMKISKILGASMDELMPTQ